MTWHIIFAATLFLLLYNYLLYPLLLHLLGRKKKENRNRFSADDEFPTVSILLSAYNEEKIIKEKIKSMLALDYPAGKMEILIASDASSDNTNSIIESFAETGKHPGKEIKFIPFGKRTGKVSIINSLAEMAEGEIIAVTDANIMHEPLSLKAMVSNFKNPKIGLVDSVLRHRGLSSSGISLQEKTYVQTEAKIKEMEGLVWGKMIGPSGAFYAIRKKLYIPVPKKLLVDDFYIGMKVLEQGYLAVCEAGAIATEDVSNNPKEEFRRKKRIAAGSYQNLAIFSRLLLRPFSATGFCFLSHKVLRWMGPLLIALVYVSSLILYPEPVFRIIFWTQTALMLVPFIDFFLRKIKIHIVFLRFITHFYNTNLALLAGFIWYIKGVKTNVWQPTRRNQS